MSKEKKLKLINLLAILSLYFIAMSSSLVTPAMEAFSQHFVGMPAVYISTLPSLLVLVGTLISGALMGKVVKYRTLGIFASLFILVGGFAPAFFDNFYALLACRVVVGLGLGLLAPLGTALIVTCYTGQQQANILGYGTVTLYVGGIVMSLVGGVLADMGWQFVFWGYLIAVASLVLAFFLPEPLLVEESAQSEKKEKLSPMVWVIALVYLVYTVASFLITVNISTLFMERAGASAVVASMTLSLGSVAGGVGGLAYGFVFKHAKRWCMSIGFLMAGVAMFIIYMGTSVVLMTIGYVLLSFGAALLMTSFYSWSGMATSIATASTALAIITATGNVGGFLSTYWGYFLTAVFGESLYSAIICAAVIDLILAVIFAVRSPFAEKSTAE